MKNEPIGKPIEGPGGETFEDFDGCDYDDPGGRHLLLRKSDHPL
jgi:hypothetical protein